MPIDTSGDGKNNPGAWISKIPLNLRRFEFSTEWGAPLDDWNPSWFALMKEASKCSETLQEYRSGYENPVGEFLDSDLK